jgi:hypothetical protein
MLKERVDVRRVGATEFWHLKCHALYTNWAIGGAQASQTRTGWVDSLGTPLELGQLFERVTGFRKAIAMHLSCILDALIYARYQKRFLHAAGAMLSCIDALIDAVGCRAPPSMYHLPAISLPRDP